MLFITFKKSLKKRLQWWGNKETFIHDGRQYQYFVHNQNCGWPPFRMTERSVELSLADSWLAEHEGDPSVIEIGAVTPYYWPRRVLQVIDPYDSNKLTEKKSLFDVSLFGRKVLSISTFEHIGTGEYKQESELKLGRKAIEKLTTEADHFLITMPVGHNKFLDSYIFENWNLLNRTKVSFLKRRKGMFDNLWSQKSAKEVVNADYRNSADGLIILKR